MRGFISLERKIPYVLPETFMSFSKKVITSRIKRINVLQEISIYYVFYNESKKSSISFSKRLYRKESL